MPAFPEQIKDIWNRLPMSGRIATISAAVATLGLIAAIVYYGSQPDYGVLFSDLNPTDAQNIVEKLKASNVPYSLVNGGTTIQVPNEKISELRLQMAGAGVISGGHVGFDLFDKTNFGATDFAQQVNYRRAIEGELAKTLESMEELEGARVHITPKKESVFSEKEEGAKASVMLRVKQGKQLAEERTDAIVNLVSNSVEGLDPANVSVMDTRGRLLTSGHNKSGGNGDAGAFNAQLEAKQKFEAENAARIIALLEPVVGEGRVRADIAADVDFSQIEQTEEKYNPQSQVIRSQQTANQTQTTTKSNQNGGIVGARSNDPTLPNPPVPQNSQSGNDQKTATTTNYEIDKTVKKTIGGGGRVNRLTVSVVVDHKNVGGTEVARTADEIKQMQDLVSAAVGVDTNRGDSVVVQTMPFDKPEIEAGSTGWIIKNNQIIKPAIKYGTLVLVALLILFFIIRPARKALKAAIAPSADEPNLLTDGTEESEEDAEKREEMHEKGREIPELEPMMTVAELEAKMDGTILGTEEFEEDEKVKIETVRKALIDQTIREPEMVVSTLRGWLRE
jgi:flagellar M-ring protein FliF